MSDIAIRVESLGKQYRIGRRQASYGSVRDSIAETFFAPFRAARFLVTRNSNGLTPDSDKAQSRILNSQVDKFWALKDVCFEVKRGEIVGIIGRNGAGKSTLLKILSRITEPTTGAVDIYGRVGSLLEVGTGFHPELTGRENVFLNGSILGMKRTEIQNKFDEIVAFAEVEKFIDTPVKHYSSGMYIRLAFGVAAHLETEILVIDEVLAVGDAPFQKKCLGKIDDVAKQGRTVLFVSHNMVAIEHLCSSAVLLDSGGLVGKGASGEIVGVYLKQSLPSGNQSLVERKDREGTGDIRFTAITLLEKEGKRVDCFRCGDDAVLRLHFENRKCSDLKNIEVDIGVDNELGFRVLWLSTRLMTNHIGTVPHDVNWLDVLVPELPLMPGRYTFTICATLSDIVADWIKGAAYFDVEPKDYFGNGRLPAQGSYLVKHHFLLPENSRSEGASKVMQCLTLG